MIKKVLLDNIKIERRRRLFGLTNPDPHSKILWNKVLRSTRNNDDKSRLIIAYNFAKKIDYNHPGMDPDIYFAHPLRVASYSFLHLNSNNINLAITGLVHNVFELSNYSKDYIENLFDNSIVKQVENLTVDRNLQYDLVYKKSYYNKIMNGSFEARIVKIFDKIDNLFTLSLNPDKIVRKKYLEEIETFILPMAKNDLPFICDYINELVKFNYKVGYLTE
jgi:(p)ppGpp synthase/HD superfamily hydrolase